MRLFAGLDLPEQVQQKVARFVEELRPAPGARLSPATNLHITTKFIGEWPELRLEELKAKLATIRSSEIAISLRGLGWFPNPHHPRFFFAAVRAPQTLSDLAAATSDACAQLGIRPETRPYTPHVTLARLVNHDSLVELRRKAASLDSADFGEFIASAFHLYLSQPGPDGSVYSKLATFPLVHA